MQSNCDISSFPVNSNETPLQRTQNDQSGIMTNFVHLHRMDNRIPNQAHAKMSPSSDHIVYGHL